jgi:hypothetical protein
VLSIALLGLDNGVRLAEGNASIIRALPEKNAEAGKQQ